MSDVIHQALVQLAGFVQGWPHPAAIIGGIAIVARVRPRLTRDIDLVIAVAENESQALLDAARRHGYDFDPEETREFIQGGLVRLWSPPSRTEGFGLDLLFVDSPFLERVVERATPLDLGGGVTLPVATVEDLLLLKLDANRNSDLEDVIAIKDAFGERLDLGYVRDQARALGLTARLEVFFPA